MMLICKKKYLLLFVFLANAVLITTAQQKKKVVQTGNTSVQRPQNLTDEQLLDLVQKQTFRYFWDFAHPVSGMARERSNSDFGYGHETVTTGGTGFGIMSVIVAAERKWITRDTAAKFLLKMVNFLVRKPTSYHGAYSHWLDGETGKTIPFGRRDDGGDLVETSFLFQGLLCARQYFSNDNPVENELRGKIGWLWAELEFSWYRNNQDVLFWHWSPNNGWAMNFAVRGFNECLIMYVLAASSKTYPIDAKVYHDGWAQSNFFKNGKKFYDIELPLGFDYGGPLFFSHYSFLGLNPKGLKDRYADYWKQNVNHTLINYTHCVKNPNAFKGYGENCWGLTASDTYNGYNAHSPTNDFGTITPSAALSAFPYTPELSMKALKHFYYDLGDKIWGEYGFTDAFNESQNWYSKNYLAIDQGPIIVMIENYRSGLIWNLFMSIPEIKDGLKKLGFESENMK